MELYWVLKLKEVKIEVKDPELKLNEAFTEITAQKNLAENTIPTLKGIEKSIVVNATVDASTGELFDSSKFVYKSPEATDEE